MKNSIVLISINRDKYLKYSLPTVEKYCDKHNIGLELITKPKWGFENKNGYNYLTFEKNQTYDFFDKYDRILRLDSDVIITPNCPNLFENTDFDYIYVVFEDVGSRLNNRRKQMKLIQKTMGNINGWNSGYFNSGVVLSSKKHAEMYNIEKIQHKIYKLNLGLFKEQTLLNWNVRNLGFEIKNLGFEYNHMSMFGNDYNKSKIIHFAGSQNSKEEKIKKIYNKFYSK